MHASYSVVLITSTTSLYKSWWMRGHAMPGRLLAPQKGRLSYGCEFDWLVVYKGCPTRSATGTITTAFSDCKCATYKSNMQHSIFFFMSIPFLLVPLCFYYANNLIILSMVFNLFRLVNIFRAYNLFCAIFIASKFAY